MNLLFRLTMLNFNLFSQNETQKKNCTIGDRVPTPVKHNYSNTPIKNILTKTLINQDYSQKLIRCEKVGNLKKTIKTTCMNI